MEPESGPMEWSPEELYARYVAALEFFNAQAERRHADDGVRRLLRLPIRSRGDFSGWWTRVCRDVELKRRWLERFQDPPAAFDRAKQEFSLRLRQIAVRRTAA